MNHTITLILLVSCIVPAAAPVLAQETPNNTTSTPTATATSTATATPTATSTPTSGSSGQSDRNESVALVLSETLRISEWHYAGGTFVITFESDRYQAVSLTAVPESGGSGKGTVSANYQERYVQPNRETVVRIDAPKNSGRARVWIVSDASSETGTVHALEAGRSSSLLSGPFDGSDVRDVGIGSSIGTALGALYVVARAKLGADQRGERLA